jgi:hypothetical protein
LIEFIDKDRALGLQIVDHVGVVDDFMAHVDRRAKTSERLLDDGDRAVHPGAKTARAGEQDLRLLPCQGWIGG